MEARLWQRRAAARQNRTRGYIAVLTVLRAELQICNHIGFSIESIIVWSEILRFFSIESFYNRIPARARSTGSCLQTTSNHESLSCRQRHRYSKLSCSGDLSTDQLRRGRGRGLAHPGSRCTPGAWCTTGSRRALKHRPSYPTRLCP